MLCSCLGLAWLGLFVLLCPVLSCLIECCRSCLVFAWFVSSCLDLSRLVSSCLVLSCLVLVLFCLVLPCPVLSLVGMACLRSVTNVTVPPALALDVVIAPRLPWLVSLVLSCLGLPLHDGFSALLAFLAQTHRLFILVRENCFTSHFIPLQSLCRVWVLALVRGAKGAAAKTLRRM